MSKKKREKLFKFSIFITKIKNLLGIKKEKKSEHIIIKKHKKKRKKYEKARRNVANKHNKKYFYKFIKNRISYKKDKKGIMIINNQFIEKIKKEIKNKKVYGKIIGLTFKGREKINEEKINEMFSY